MAPTAATRSDPLSMTVTILQVHATDLPCPACSYAVEHKIFDEADFCGGPTGCGHYHTESECPIKRTV